MKGDIDKDLTRENLRRISTNFELELLRLIKTLNLISQSRELYRNQMDQVDALTEKYKAGLSAFTVKLLDAERKSATTPGPGIEDPYAAPRESESQVHSFTGIVDELRQYLNEMGTEIEKSRKEHIDKLESVYSIYNLELGASQKDLDEKLLRLQNELSSLTGSGIDRIEQKKNENSRTAEDYTKPKTAVITSAEKTYSREVDEKRKDIIAPPGKRAETTEKELTSETVSEKAKPSSQDTVDKTKKETEKDSGIKSTYMISAGLLIFGIIIGVLFYDVLMRRWGIEQYSEQEIIDGLESAEIINENGAQVPETDTMATKPAEELPGTTEPDGISTPDASALIEEWEKSGEIAGEEYGVTVDDETEKAVQSPKTEKETRKEPTKEPSTSDRKIYTVIGAGANVRSGPGMNHSIVTVVRGGQEFKGTGERQGRWYKIIAPDGKEGWISGKIITEVKK